MKLLSLKRVKYKDASIKLKKPNILNEAFKAPTVKNKEYKPKKSLPLFFLVMISIITTLTIATSQYYYQLTVKVSKQRQAVITLYKELETTRKEKMNSQLMLNEILSQETVQKGFFYFMDQENALGKKAQDMMNSYKKHGQYGSESLNLKKTLFMIILMVEILIICYLIVNFIRLERDYKEISFLLQN